MKFTVEFRSNLEILTKIKSPYSSANYDRKVPLQFMEWPRVDPFVLKGN